MPSLTSSSSAIADGGFARVGIIELGTDSPFGPLQELPFSRETGTLGFAGNPEFSQTSIRLLFTSMSTPAVIYQHSVADGTDTVLKRQPVLGSVDLDSYSESLVWASAEDGTQVPISLVYRTDLVALRFRHRDHHLGEGK